MLKIPPFCAIFSFLIVFVNSLHKILKSSRTWIIFIMSFIPSFGIIKVVAREAEDEGWPEPCIFFWIPASIAEAAALVPNRVKILFPKGTATFFNGPGSLFNNDPKNPQSELFQNFGL